MPKKIKKIIDKLIHKHQMSRKIIKVNHKLMLTKVQVPLKIMKIIDKLIHKFQRPTKIVKLIHLINQQTSSVHED